MKESIPGPAARPLPTLGTWLSLPERIGAFTGCTIANLLSTPANISPRKWIKSSAFSSTSWGCTRLKRPTDEQLAQIGHTHPTLGDPPPDLYAASCRWTRQGKRTLLQAWSHVLTLGEPLPTLPLWLSTVLVVPLNLEQSYEQACSDLWIS